MILTFVCYIVGDFNVDFGRDGCLKDLIVDFMFDLNLSRVTCYSVMILDNI